MYLVFTSSNPTLGISGDINNPYSRGQVYASSGFASYPNYDYTFRTFYDDQQPVPEPTTMLLFGTGLVSLAGFRLRRKKKQ
jgi:hypothetical protein